MFDVSVLMFTYRPSNSNRKKYIIKSLKSLAKQQDIKIQAVILDDGSPTPIHKSLLKDTEFVSFDYHYYDENRGKHVMMDIGLPMMKAEVMTTLHDDDYLSNNHSLYNRFNCFYKEPDTALIWTDAIYMRGKTTWRRSRGRSTKQPKQHSHSFLLKHNYICGASYLVRTDLKQRFRAHKSLKHAEEYDIWLQISKYARDNNLSFRYCPTITAVYRFHKEQSWNKVRKLTRIQRGRLYENAMRRRNE